MTSVLKNLLRGAVVFAIVGLGACSGQPAKTDDAGKTDDSIKPISKSTSTNKDEIIFGTTFGDFADMVRDGVSDQLVAKGYKITLVEFDDYELPNIALANGEIDVNVFQHQPYLSEFAKSRNLDLFPVFQVPTPPLGLYAGRLSRLEDVRQGTTIAVPDDPTNFARALVMLDAFGWIKVDPTKNHLKLTIKDIKQNVHGIKLVGIDASKIPESRSEVDFAIINGNFASGAGIPLTEALYKEPNYTFINVGVVRTEDKDAPWVDDVVEAYKSRDFREYSYQRFPGYQYPQAWNDVPGRRTVGPEPEKAATE